MSAGPLGKRLEDVSRRAARGMDFGLDRVRAALARLGDPQDAVATVHVAGTNGKGSTAAMIEAIARAAGLATGLYTSPHLCKIAERIRLGGDPIDDARFEGALGAVLDRCAPDLTFFETLTVAAFAAFRDAAVDLAIVEVGLGGRLDATNTMRAPACTAITSIDLDHTELLGTTLAEIAREKAGILRPGVPLVIGPVGAEAREAIEGVARAVGAAPVVVVPPAAGRAPRRVGLAGPHQQDNAAVAAAVATALGPPFGALASHVGAGLAAVRWPGRFERVARGDVTIVLDCAHNPEGARALAATLDAEGILPARTTLVFGALADKDHAAALRELAPHAHRRIYTSPRGRAPAPFAALVATAPGDTVDEPRAALERAVTTSPPGETVLVTGSSYLVGELRAHLLGIFADPVIAL